LTDSSKLGRVKNIVPYITGQIFCGCLLQ
jgi:hypothetical protein